MNENFFNIDEIPKNNNNKNKSVDLEIIFRRNDENKYFIFVNNEGIRQNSEDIKNIILNDENNIDENGLKFLQYFIHKLSFGKTMYQILNDCQIIFKDLKNSNLKIKYEDKKLKFSKEEFSPKITFNMEKKNSNIILNIEKINDFIFGIENIYILKENSIYEIKKYFPQQFYKQIFEKKKYF